MTITRANLLRRVEAGRLTLQVADLLAARKPRFIGPLACEPPPEQFDAMQEPYWTLAMAFAWAIWRSPEKVREYWNEWRLRKDEWQPTKDEKGQQATGFILNRLKAISLHDVWWVAANAFEITADEERDRLWKALGEGRLEASAIDPATGKPISIPRTAWLYLSKINYYDGDEESVSTLDGLTLLYRRVMVERDRAVALWPAPGTKSEPAQSMDEEAGPSPPAQLTDAPTTVDAKPPRKRTQLQKIVLEVIAELWPDGSYPPTVDQRNHTIIAKIKVIHGRTISYKTIERLWTELDN